MFARSSALPALASELAFVYGDFNLVAPDQFADFHIEIRKERLISGGLRAQARFVFDGLPSFDTLPLSNALPMVEWGLNWCVASHAHQYLIIHAAVLERGGHAVMMPAPPGSGKVV